MEESDVEMEVVFDDNIRVKKKDTPALKDKTNKAINFTKPLAFYNEKENINNENSVLQKYNLDFDYEEDRMTNEINNKFVDDISDKLRIFSDKLSKENVTNNFNINRIHFDKVRRNNLKMYMDNTSSKAFLNSNTDMNDYEIDKNISEHNRIKNSTENHILAENPEFKENNQNILVNNASSSIIYEIQREFKENNQNILVNNASSSIIYEIQREFNDLKESHKTMLLLRNRLLVLLDKEVQIIKKEVEDKKNEEISRIEKEYKSREDKLKKESEYYKNRYNKFKEYCREKVLEYKKKIDSMYKKRRN